MIFVIEYDKHSGKTVRFMSFEHYDLIPAEDMRLSIELDLHREGVSHEVVILDAENEEALRKTHGRYFRNRGVNR